MQQIDNTKAKSFRIFSSSAPLPLQVIGGLMWLAGLGMILQGIPLLLFFGLGILPIVLGGLNIKYAKKIFKMQEKGYRGTMILQGVMIITALMLWAISGLNSVNSSSLGIIAMALLIIAALYLYRDKFIKASPQV